MNITHEVKAGLFIALSLTLLFISVFVMGREREIFSSQKEYLTSFKDIKGLSAGAPVRLGGITIGRVDGVAFSELLEDPNVHVKILINEDFLERIRTDSIVTIETQGLLGDRFINISTGRAADLLPPGSPIPSEEGGDVAQILSKAQKVVDNTVDIASQINVMLKGFNTDAAPDVNAAARSLKGIFEKIESGDGLIHRMIYSKKDSDEMMKALTTASTAVADITSKVKSGDGVLHALIYEPGGKEMVASLSTASQKLATLAGDVSALTQQIKDGNGLVHDMIYGESPKGIDEILKQLNETAANLNAASSSLSQGSGTLGALLVDSQLYDNLVEVTDSAKRSYLLRQAIQSSLDQ